MDPLALVCTGFFFFLHLFSDSLYKIRCDIVTWLQIFNFLLIQQILCAKSIHGMPILNGKWTMEKERKVKIFSQEKKIIETERIYRYLILYSAFNSGPIKVNFPSETADIQYCSVNIFFSKQSNPEIMNFLCLL